LTDRYITVGHKASGAISSGGARYLPEIEYIETKDHYCNYVLAVISCRAGASAEAGLTYPSPLRDVVAYLSHRHLALTVPRR
jgi:hypothetical protein